MKQKVKPTLLFILFLLLLIFIIWRLLCYYNKEKFIVNPKTQKVPYDYQLLYRSILAQPPEKLSIRVEPYNPNTPPPKKVFRSWCSKDLNKSCGGRPGSPQVVEDTMKVLGKQWEQIIYDDKKIEQMLNDENFLGKNHKITKAYYMLNEKYGAARSDLFRYLVIYRYGGLYLDMKSCVTKNKIPDIPKGKDMITSLWDYEEGSERPNSHLFPGSGEYQNWYIYARPRAPIILDIIERVVQNIYDLHKKPYLNLEILAEDVPGTLPAKNKVLTTTGPIALTIAVMNSKNKNTVLIDNKMNKILNYYCDSPDLYDKTSTQHYSKQTEPLVKPLPNAPEIPMTAYFTYHNLLDIPKYVIDNIKKYCNKLEVQINDDKQCEDFLLGFFGKEAVDIFRGFEFGAHKADFWRYCNLYVYGGCYFDIKTDFQVPILSQYNFNKPKQWYTVIDRTESKIYNGIIITPPFNPVIGEAIKFIYQNNPPSNYDLYIENLYNILQKMCPARLKAGDNFQSNGWTCTLLQENCTEECGENCDRYGLACNIRDYKGKLIYNTRYIDFPWKSKEEVVENFSRINNTKQELGELPSCFQTQHVEHGERVVADLFTPSDACVLEFGGGSGAVSTIVNRKLNNPKNHVVVQPNDSQDNSEKEKPMYGGVKNLTANRDACGCQYSIIDHILDKDEGKNIASFVEKPFDTLIVDCEGCLIDEYNKNPYLFDNITMIQVERDDTDGMYTRLLKGLGFTLSGSGQGCDGRCSTEVWTRNL